MNLSADSAGFKYGGPVEPREPAPHESVQLVDDTRSLAPHPSRSGALSNDRDIWKPALSRGEIQCIAPPHPANTASPWKRPFAERRFQSAKFRPDKSKPCRDPGRRERYEKFHAVSYTTKHSVIRLSFQRYIPDRFLPDKASPDDEAGARVKLRQATVPEEVGEVRNA